jgi:hypothetical protein
VMVRDGMSEKEANQVCMIEVSADGGETRNLLDRTAEVSLWEAERCFKRYGDGIRESARRLFSYRLARYIRGPDDVAGLRRSAGGRRLLEVRQSSEGGDRGVSVRNLFPL